MWLAWDGGGWRLWLAEGGLSPAGVVEGSCCCALRSCCCRRLQGAAAILGCSGQWPLRLAAPLLLLLLVLVLVLLLVLLLLLLAGAAGSVRGGARGR